MRIVPDFIVGSLIVATAMGAAQAQPATPPSAPLPATAASKAIPVRNPAITAAENAKEAGEQRPAERVIPQISVPLRSRNITLPVATAASTSTRPGSIDDSAARCLAAKDKAACELQAKASAPLKAGR